MENKTGAMSMEFAFYRLMQNWSTMSREYRLKYGSSKCKHFSGEGIGEKKMREMLESAGYIGIWYYKAEDEVKGGIL